MAVACVVITVYQVAHSITERICIGHNPVETEATVTEIGDSPIIKHFRRTRNQAGRPVYYDYTVGDSLYHGVVCPGNKKVEKMWVGQTISLTYEKDNLSNSMYDGTLSIQNLPAPTLPI